MTDQGTCYLLLPSPRNSLLPDLAHYLGLNITFKDNKDPHYLETFPLHRAPSFESKDGFKLHEAMTILKYFISLRPVDCKYNFFGHSKREEAQVWQWVSFTNSDCIVALVDYLDKPMTPEGKKAAWKWSEQNAQEFERQLERTPYLVGSEKTLADIYGVQLFIWGFQVCWYKDWLAKYPAIEKWFRKIVDNDEIVSRTYKGFGPEK
ncbi:DEBR0S2_09494g1_1 [Brettanomyces bruxellensis]|uniref:DEBR0S2_09494g1_1 n=1 Tax=Dekkera bruxellensis TaxID=5007 RepID=A0A7D9GYQ3_DEKBR|nr:DEBR0S2_09494g1_1 [Brettanomyces bruxellensis]